MHLEQYENAIGAIRRTDAGGAEKSMSERGFQTAGARGFWATLKAQQSRQPPDDYFLAAIYSRLGRNGDALDSLERAWAHRNPGLIYMKHEAYFDPLANEPRFEQLKKSLHLN